MENVVAISIMVVGGVLLAIIVSAICGNRKLRRHKECSRRDPHVPGVEANKAMRVEIERRLDRVAEVKYEPLLLNADVTAIKPSQHSNGYYRMKALDHLKYLEREMTALPGVAARSQHESLRGFLLRLTQHTGGAAVLRGLEPRLLHQLCDQHAHARYHAIPFTKHNLTHTHALMLRVLHCGRSGGRKTHTSDEKLKAPSDHDSAIDADPSEFEPPDPSDPTDPDPSDQILRVEYRSGGTDARNSQSFTPRGSSGGGNVNSSEYHHHYQSDDGASALHRDGVTSTQHPQHTHHHSTTEGGEESTEGRLKGDQMRQVSGEVRQKNNELRYKPSDLRQKSGDMRQSAGDVRHKSSEMRHKSSDAVVKMRKPLQRPGNLNIANEEIPE